MLSNFDDDDDDDDVTKIILFYYYIINGNNPFNYFLRYLFANVCVMSSTATYPEIIITYYYSCETGSATGSNILVIPPLVLLRFYLKTPFSVKVSSTTQLKIMYLFLYISTKNAAIFEKKTKQ